MAGIAGFAILICIIYACMTIYQESQMTKLVFEDIDMLKVEDGTYIGTAQAGFVNVEAEVTVENHQITNIVILKHENGFGSKAEKITEEMIKNNTYDVDVVSGATASSETIKNAVCNALLQGT